MILKLIAFVLWMVLIPFLIGTLFYPNKYCSIPKAISTGFIAMWAAFQVITVPFVLKQKNFKDVNRIYTAACLLVAVLALICILLRMKKYLFPDWKNLFLTWQDSWKQSGFCTSFSTIALWTFFIASVLFQLYKVFTLAYADGDDAFYLSISSAASLGGGMYELDPYTGVPTTLDVRHGLAPFPIWVSFCGKKLGVNPGVAAHSLLPLVLIPVTYLIYVEIGRTLLAKKEGYFWQLPLFGFIVSLLQLFGNYSICPPSTFLLTRTRQGKEAVGNIVIPFLILVLLWMLHLAEEEIKADGQAGLQNALKNKIQLTILLMAAMTAGCLCSTMSSLLLALLIVLVAGMGSVLYKKWWPVFCGLLGCLPGIFFAGLYMILK